MLAPRFKFYINILDFQTGHFVARPRFRDSDLKCRGHELIPCSMAKLAVLHGSSTTWFQTSHLLPCLSRI